MTGITLITTLAALGVIGGFFSGLLGFGGGVLMFPLLYYVPPLFSLPKLDAKIVAAIVISQVFFSTIIGGMAHLRRRRVHGRITLVAGITSATGSLAGGIVSGWTSEHVLLVLFGIISAIVLLMMFLPAPNKEQEEVSVEKVTVPLLPLSVCSLATGIVIGFLGAGNFVFVPLLIYVLKVPTRIAIGSSLFIAMMNTFSGFLGKLITGQIPLMLATSVVVGAAAGALVGEKIHRQVSAQTLRQIYAVMVWLIAIRVWITIVGFND
ncbi:MAG: sulfite exporter TauE/SafE family protein [Candidatus Binatia bacterium]